MTSQVEVPPLTGLIHFNSGKRRVKFGTNAGYNFLHYGKENWPSLASSSGIYSMPSGVYSCIPSIHNFCLFHVCVCLQTFFCQIFLWNYSTYDLEIWY